MAGSQRGAPTCRSFKYRCRCASRILSFALWTFDPSSLSPLQAWALRWRERVEGAVLLYYVVQDGCGFAVQCDGAVCVCVCGDACVWSLVMQHLRWRCACYPSTVPLISYLTRSPVQMPGSTSDILPLLLARSWIRCWMLSYTSQDGHAYSRGRPPLWPEA